MFSRPQLCAFAVAAAICLPTLVGAQTIGVAWRNNLDAAKIEAAQTNRLLLLHFWTRSCAPCKVLDQNVLSQPQVGAAVEREYVPVKIDADASPAMAHMFNIEYVPTEVVLTPQGNIVATLKTPETPDAYVAQLQNLARHFRQTTPGAIPGVQAPTVNAAYAGLPQQMSNPPANSMASAARSQAVAPQQQSNPYVAAATVTAQPPVSSNAIGAAPGVVASSGVPPAQANTTPQRYGATGYSPQQPPSASVAGAAVTPPPAENPAYAGAGAGAPAQTPPSSYAPANQFAVASAQAAIQPAQLLPANCPPVAFDGCCPVTLKALNKWAAGTPSFGAIHRGRTYLFVGDAERRQFLADPDSYSPVFAGYDPVLLLERQQTVPGSRKFGFKYGNAFYLFSCAETRDKFQASPHTYAAGVRQAMARVDGGAGHTVLR